MKINEFKFPLMNFQNFPVPMFIINKSKEIIIWNSLMEKISQIKKENIIGLKIFKDLLTGINKDYYLNSDSIIVEKFWELLNYKIKFDECTILSKELHIHKTNSTRDYLTYAIPLFDSEKNFVGGCQIFIDISEQVEAEELLAKELIRLKAIFNKSNDAIIIHDIFGNIKDCSLKAKELFKFDCKDNSNNHKSNNFYNFVIEKDKIALINEHKLKGSNYTSSFQINIETKFIDTHEGIFNAEYSSSILNLGDETLILSNIRDISERKRIEKEQMKMQKFESLEIIARGIAHDFNNLMTSILGNLSLLELEIEGKYIGLNQLVKDAEKATRRAAVLTKQLLTFSRGEIYNKKNVNLKNLLEKSARFVLHGSDVKLILKIQENLPPVYIDKEQISRVINNLIINSIQAMEKNSEGNKIITIDASEIKFSYGEYVQISVTDNGPGIPKELIDKIFDPYFTTKDNDTGLGLTICFSIIKKHGGFIHCESEFDNGTTFNILLPIYNQKLIDKINTIH